MEEVYNNHNFKTEGQDFKNRSRQEHFCKLNNDDLASSKGRKLDA